MHSVLDLAASNDPHLIYNVFVSQPIGTSDRALVVFNLNMHMPLVYPILRRFSCADYDKTLAY